MKEIDVEPGMSIRKAAERMLVEVIKSQEDVFCTFNDICVTATLNSSVNSICADYERLSEIRREEYRKTPEYAERQRQQEEDRNRLQSKADFLMAELPLMDFTDTGLLIRWLSDIEESRDRIGVNVDSKKIQDVFKSYGYEPNAYTGKDFVKGNPEIEARWLIGQAIADVYVPMVRHFAPKLARN